LCTGLRCLPLTRGVYVHDNSVTLRAAEAGVGAVAFDGLVGLFRPEANNRFHDNSYRVIDPGAAYWSWNGEIITWNQWHALGTGRKRHRRADCVTTGSWRDRLVDLTFVANLQLHHWEASKVLSERTKITSTCASVPGGPSLLIRGVVQTEPSAESRSITSSINGRSEGVERELDDDHIHLLQQIARAGDDLELESLTVALQESSSIWDVETVRGTTAP
jgi:hypothetical protein